MSDRSERTNLVWTRSHKSVDRNVFLDLDALDMKERDGLGFETGVHDPPRVVPTSEQVVLSGESVELVARVEW